MELATICGNVTIQNVSIEVTDSDMENILIGDDVLKRLGIDVDGLVDDRGGMIFDMDHDSNPPMYFGDNDEQVVRDGLLKLLVDAKANGLPEDKSHKWELILKEYADVFRAKLGNDPPAKVPPMLVRFDKNSKPIRHRNRRYPKIHRDFMDYYVKKLEDYGLIYRNQNARYVSSGYVVPKTSNPTDITKDPTLLHPVNPVNKNNHCSKTAVSASDFLGLLANTPNGNSYYSSIQHSQ